MRFIRYILSGVFIIIFGVLNGGVKAQSVLDPYVSSFENNFVLQQWTIDDGLPVNAINNVIQGQKGYIWIATYDGLARFDGIKFKVFQRRIYPGIGNNRMDHLFEDTKGRLWIYGEREALIKYEDDEFITFVNSTGFTNGEIKNIVEDKSGTIWIGTSEGIFTYSESKMNLFSDVPVVDVAIEQNEKVWVATSTKLLSIEKNEIKESFTFDQKPGIEIVKLFMSAGNSLWISTTKGLFKYQGSEVFDLESAYSIEPEGYSTFLETDENHVIVGGAHGFHFLEIDKGQEKHFLAGIEIRELFQDINDRVWVIGWNGKTYIFDIQTETVTDVTETLGFQNSRINGVMEDQENNLWFSADPGGLFQLKPSLVRHITTQNNLSVNNILSLLEDDQNNIWVGTRDGGLNFISSTGIVNLTKDKGLPNPVIQSLAQDSNGTIWAGMYRDGIALVEPDATELNQLSGINPNLAIYAIHHSKKTAWVGTEKGLVRIRDKKFRFFTEADGLPHYIIRVIIEDQVGGLWLGTNGGGVAYFRNGKVERVYDETNGLSSNRIRSIHIDEENPEIIWVGTEDKGLNRIDEDGITIFLKDHGLYDEVIHQILEFDGKLWMSTNRGIFNVQKSQLQAFKNGEINQIFCQVFGKSEGMLNIEGNGGSQFAGIKTHDNKLLFATQAGVAVIDPAKLSESYRPPPMEIEEVRVGETEFASVDTISFPPGTSTMEIEYAALSFQSPERIEYAYKMEGADEDWNQVGNRQTAYYTNLKNGEYVFRVRARNSEGIWSENEASFSFSIEPHFYETSWFIALAGLFFVGLLVTGWQLRVRQLYRKQKELERLVGERTKDLNLEKQEVEKQKEVIEELSEAKDHFFANISHELRTPLTLVLGPLEQLKSAKITLDDEWQHLLSIANRNGLRLQELVEQVLDLTRIDSNKLELRLEKVEVVGLVKLISESFESLADSRKITFETVQPETPVFAAIDRDKFQKIIVNLISNAIKFTPEEGKIIVRTKPTADKIYIEIKDTGRGIEPERIPFIFDRFHTNSERISGGGHGIGVGLNLTKEFIDLHEGSIEVSSDLEKGTVFTITFPKRENLFPELDVSEEVEPDFLPASKIEDEPVLPDTKSYKESDIKILLVEDNPDMRAYIAGLLAKENFNVTEAENGIEGKKKLILNPPDLILTDVMMPGMDGFEFAKYVRSVPEFKLIPLLMLTALSGQDERIQAFNIGVSDYLNKPFNERELKARISNLLRLKLEREEALSQTVSEEEKPSEAYSFINMLKEYVQEQISTTDITVEKLCDLVNMSRRQLYRRLKEETGFTPGEFVREIKLIHARHILERKQKKTISEVAYAVGFSTSSYFTKLYKERFGVHPGDMM